MKTRRLTVSAIDVERQTEPEFLQEFTKRLLAAGFDLDQDHNPIIRQPRSDIEGAADFIQFRYSFLDTWIDRVGIEYRFFKDKIGKLIRQKLNK